MNEKDKLYCDGCHCHLATGLLTFNDYQLLADGRVLCIECMSVDIKRIKEATHGQ